MRRGDRQLMVDMNRNLALHALRNKGQASRADIVRDTGLSATTVSVIVAALIDSGLVTEVGQGRLTRGRPPLVLELDNTRNYVVGVRLMSTSIVAVLTDLHGTVLQNDRVPLPGGLPQFVPGSLRAGYTAVYVEPEPVLDAVCAAVEYVIEKAAVLPEKVLGIGIGIGGLVDAGVCLYSPIFGWADLPIAEPISTRLGYPVLVENDVNALAIAELWFGHGRGIDNFIVAIAGRGVGIGIIVNGQLYRGADGVAGEAGHMPIPGVTARCSCGRVGCLEAVSADYAVFREVAATVRPHSPLAGLAPEDITLDAVRQAADAGDVACAEALKRAGFMLGLGLAGVVNVLNPRLLILAGEGMAAGPLRFDAMREALREGTMRRVGERLRFIAEPVDDFTWARGAACAMAGELFRPPIHRARERADSQAETKPADVKRIV